MDLSDPSSYDGVKTLISGTAALNSLVQSEKITLLLAKNVKLAALLCLAHQVKYEGEKTK